MKTEELIAMLAKEPATVDRGRHRLRVLAYLAIGFAATFAALLVWFKVNPDLMELAMHAWFWVRFTFIASSAAIAWFVLSQLGKPGFAWRVKWWYLAIPFTLLAAIALATFVRAPAEERMAMLMGISWDVCSRNIAVLSIPIFIASIFIARQFAPVRLRMTGAVLGFFSGATAAFVYSLYCPEIEPMFVGLWYALGIAIPAVVGAALGKRLLSW
jgi:hypothetical protein